MFLMHLATTVRFFFSFFSPKKAKTTRTRARQPTRHEPIVREEIASSSFARPARRVDAYGDARPRRCARGRLPRLTGGRRPGRGVPARKTRRVASPRWWAPPRIRTPRDAPPPRARRPRNRASPSALLHRRPRPRARRTHPAGPAHLRRASPRVGPRSRCGASRQRARARAWRPPSSDASPWNEPRVRSVRPVHAKVLLRPRATRGRLPPRRTRFRPPRAVRGMS